MLLISEFSMELKLPKYEFKIKKDPAGKDLIYDEFRKKYVVLTPEEWVRQNFLRFLKSEKNYPASLMSLERQVSVNKMIKRFDAVIYKNGKPVVLIEFKSPKVKIDQKVMDQISRYNLSLNVKYLIVSNGISHYCCSLEIESQSIVFLKKIPSYHDIA